MKAHSWFLLVCLLLLAAIESRIFTGWAYPQLSGAAIGLPSNDGDERRIPRRKPGFIGHIEHEGLNVSVSVLPGEDGSYLEVTMPEKAPSGIVKFVQSPRPTIRARVTTMDNSIVDGGLQVAPSAANGGWILMRYKLPLPRVAPVQDVRSVALTINDRHYTFFPF
jgi:hypothetical protein